MKILIVGAGKIGSYIARALCQEGHDITVMDLEAEPLRRLSGSLDVICVEGSGVDFALLREAGAAEADMVVAATGSDERNLICCLAAKQIGTKHTVARIREQTYLNQRRFLREGVGLYLAVSPDQEAAEEIARILEFPSATRVETFAHGRVELVEYRLPAGSVLDGIALSDLRRRFREQVLICAVKRDGKVVIPKGGFVLKSGDYINLAGERTQLRAFIKAVGDYKRAARKVMILGGSRIAVELARQLTRSGIHVVMTEQDPARAEELCALLPKADVVLGDGTRPEVLREEGLLNADAFVALTGMDENNIITSMYARSCGVDKVVTKVNEENLTAMLDGSGLDCFISPKQLAAYRITASVRALFQSGESSVETLYRLVDGQVEALEFRVGSDCRLTGKPLKELSIRADVLVAAVFREGKVLIPDGNTVMQEGDRTVVVTTAGGLSCLNAILEV